MNKTITFFIVLFLLFSSRVEAQIEEIHEFGEPNVQYFIYSSGKTWEFIAENPMTIETVEVKSVLASNPFGTFHIEIEIQDQLVAHWDQFVNNEVYQPYIHTKSVRHTMAAGDKIIYKIYGNSSITMTGGILGINHVKLIGQVGAQYDLQFSSLSDMNYAKYGAGYTTDGDYIYSVCGGLGTSPYKSIFMERYDIFTNTWIEFVTGLIPRRFCSAEYIPSQNKIYIFNGDTYTIDTYTDTVEIVDVQTGQLTYSATNPYPVKYSGSTVWDNKIYLFGGSNANGFSNRLYEFDPQTETWTRLPDMPEAKQTSGEIIDGVLYVFGGYSGSVSKRIDAYNIQNSSWMSLGEMPAGASAHATAKSGKEIWIVGSYDDIKFLAKYETETGDFSQLNSNMIGRRHCGAVVVENELYIFGGNQASTNSSTLSSLESATISEEVNVNYQNNRVIKDIVLNDSYPNPFNNTTTIKFFIPQLSTVRLKIFDVLGKEVATLVDSELPIGYHQSIFKASELSSGIYFYQLQVRDHIVTKKVIYCK